MARDAVRFWDGISERYARSPIRNEAAYEATLEKLGAYLTPEMRVLELGAGTGGTAVRLAPKVAQYTATDFAPAMVEIAKTRAAEAGLDNIRAEVASAEALPAESVDAILGFNLFHLVEDMDATLAAIAQALPVGGLFISKTPCLADMPKWLMRRLIRMALPVGQMLGKFPAPVHLLHVAEMDAAVVRAGFEIVEVDLLPPSVPSRLIVARKV